MSRLTSVVLPAPVGPTIATTCLDAPRTNAVNHRPPGFITKGNVFVSHVPAHGDVAGVRGITYVGLDVQQL